MVRLRRYEGWVWGNVGCEAVAMHLYARINFKLNRERPILLSGANY